MLLLAALLFGFAALAGCDGGFTDPGPIEHRLGGGLGGGDITLGGGLGGDGYPSGYPGTGGYPGTTPGGNPSGIPYGILTITGLPSGSMGDYGVMIFPAGTKVSTVDDLDDAMDSNKAVASGLYISGNDFMLLNIKNPTAQWKGSGNLPVVLENVYGFSMYYATVSFSNGNGTVAFSKFTEIDLGW